MAYDCIHKHTLFYLSHHLCCYMSNMFIANVFEHKGKQQSTECLFLDKMYQMVTRCTQIMLYIIFLVQDTNFNS